MDKFDRIYELHGILANGKTVISAQDIAARMECTAATVKRIIRLLRQSLNARLTAKVTIMIARRNGALMNCRVSGSVSPSST